ncbi:MAG: hypothetical protein U5R49_12610 [Deltaproteobacteria bacterium]|nr:hypothetical protein [Deltaproteobacteria bacterium]
MTFPSHIGAWVFSGMAMQEYRIQQLKKELFQEIDRLKTFQAQDMWQRRFKGPAEQLAEKISDRMFLEESQKPESDDRSEKLPNWGVLRFPDGLTYKGEIKNGIPHGKGTLILPDGSTSEAEFSNGQLNGKLFFSLLRGAGPNLSSRMTRSTPQPLSISLMVPPLMDFIGKKTAAFTGKVFLTSPMAVALKGD